MRERGSKDVRLTDFFCFQGEAYDTILMLGQNIGIAGTLDRLRLLFRKCGTLLRPGGRVLANSVDGSGGKESRKSLAGEKLGRR